LKKSKETIVKRPRKVIGPASGLMLFIRKVKWNYSVTVQWRTAYMSSKS